MDAVEAANALALWVALGTEGFEASLERNYKYGSPKKAAEYGGAEPIYHRVAVRLRPLSASKVVEITAMAERYGGKVAFTSKATSEPWLEVTW